MSALATATERFVDADGFRIRYVEQGSGDPVIHFHGAGGLRMSPAYPLLARTHRVIAFEAPGFGASAVNERTPTIGDLARTMGTAIANLGIEQYNLMGSSFGGRLALWLATQQPERVRTLVLAAPAAIRPEGHTPAGGEPRDLLYAHPERQPVGSPPDPAILAKQAALVQRLRSAPRDLELEGAFPRLTMPVLVLFGTKDRMIPPEMGRVYRALLPDCHFILVYDAGHAIDADRPEAFASVVSDFLERTDGFVVNRASSLINP